ncbi:sulfate transporter CysZ [Alteromonas ponticola]|uniref:Sulfate transporter CysZ n=1 Tax=Alteromonas aquimaris TaxID=2998417 RepID=A0ABT3P748_9ALTE|nr:sulfate transporter CysZ [Alteromonas aquimaris]MCW8108587.1 sulfate transporter CysZ [Alteromonas aquimaris]
MPAKSGISYFVMGFGLIKTKGLKRFVLIPLTVNLILFATAFYFLFGQIELGITWLISSIPDWLGWMKDVLAFILWPIAVISVLLIFALIFGTLANWIAAPFNGVLAEKVERHLTGQPLGDEGVLSLIRDIPRVLGRELSKLMWYIPRAIGFFLIFLFVPLIGQAIWFLFSAWMMAIQYCDYAYDNHKIKFSSMRDHLGQHKGSALSFGFMVNIFSLIPIINFIVMPVAICGATAMWVEKLRPDLDRRINQTRP